MTDDTVSLYEADALQRAQVAARPINYFDIPPKLAASCNVRVIGLVQLNTQEELEASRRVVAGPNEAIRSSDTAFELVKSSLRYVDGKKVNTGDGSAEFFWARTDPDFSKLRQLIMNAYAVLHNATAEDLDTFLSSQRTTPKKPDPSA